MSKLCASAGGNVDKAAIAHLGQNHPHGAAKTSTGFGSASFVQVVAPKRDSDLSKIRACLTSYYYFHLRKQE